MQNHKEHKTIVIVDAYSSGALYPDEFKKRGFNCVHVQSFPEIDPSLLRSFQPKDFLANIVHQGDVKETMRQLKPFSPAAVITGSECGVLLADELSECLGLKTNGTNLSETRRNKFLTHEILRQNGLPCADQIKSKHVEEILEWATKRNIWPVVIKPLSSAGTEGVCFCHTADEIKEAFANIIGKKNHLGLINHDVLAQEFLEGDEYIVDTVSCHGQHFVCTIFSCGKIILDNRRIYKDQNLLPSAGHVQSELSQYVLRVLDVLQMQFGPAHTEVMLTKQGPKLIEVNARLDGQKCPLLIHACTGYGQTQLSADAFVDENSFSVHTQLPYDLIKHGRFAFFISEQEGLIRSIRHVDDIQKLPSFFHLVLNVHEGERLKKTIDLTSNPGHVKLVHEDQSVIDRDYKTIRQWEQEGIFVVENL